MNLIKDSGHNLGAENNAQPQPSWLTLSGEDLARLNAKRDEIIMVLRLWHGYGQIAADRTLSNWLSDHAQGYSGHARQTPFKSTFKRLMRPDV